MDFIPYRTFEEQIELIKAKNINIKDYDRETVSARLKNHSYYALINGYKPHFIFNGQSDYMREGTTFNHFYAVKILEMDLSSILLKYLQIIEQGFRTRLSHIIAREFTTDDHEYLDDSLYVNTSGRKYKTLKYFNDLRDDPNQNSYSYYFKVVKQVSIPPWILLQDANFYNVIILYSCLPMQHRNEIRKEYVNLENIRNENKLFTDSLQLLREYRNIYAHSKRNFDEKITSNLDFNLSQICSKPCMFKRNFFNTNKKAKGLNVVIPLIINYLNDDFLCWRLFHELNNLFINDGYVDSNLVGEKIFNDLTVYEILEIPSNILNIIENNLANPSA